jgi:hypothetical protein
MAPPARDGGGEPHMIGKTVNEMLDHVSGRPVRDPHLPAELAAVFVEEIFLAVCTPFAAAMKRHTPKTFQRG